MKPKFAVKDIVTSVIDPTFRGQITSIVEQESGYLYTTTYFQSEEPHATNFFGCELELAPADDSFGFSQSQDE